MSNVKYEYELYEPMCKWLEQYLKDKNKKKSCEIIVEDCHSVTLDTILAKNDIIDEYPQAVGLDIQVDIVGIVKNAGKSELIFIEAKKTQLNLHDLGQLWAYCKLINPADAYLLSSAGTGSLSKVLSSLQREDMLDFGNGKTIKRMKVAKWDVDRASLDNASVMPKI